MRFKKITRLFALVIAIVTAMPTAVAAESFKDIPSSHWAYSAIDKVSRKGILLGDINGNFNPDAWLDKFETVKIFAALAGYKYTNVSEEEKKFYDKCYDNHKSYINLYHKFSKWNKSVDREIAFLLEIGIITREELNQYVVVMTDGTEWLRVLSREEAAVLFVRFMGEEAEALRTPYGASFSDDKDISQSAKAYVYYLKNLGVISGVSATEYKPKEAINKASMAVVIQRVLDIISPEVEYPLMPSPTPTPVSPVATPTPPLYIPTPTPSPALTPPPAAVSFQTVQGTIEKLYASFSAIQLKSLNSAENDKIYIISPSAVINIDGINRPFASLVEGMVMVGILSNSSTSGNYELVTVAAMSAPTPEPTPSIAPTPTPTPVTSTIEGTVSAVTLGANGNTVSIDVDLISPKGVIYTETRVYKVPSECTIKRGDSTVSFQTVVKGDVAALEVSGETAYSIKLEEKNRTFNAVLVEKRLIKGSSIPVLVVESSNGKRIELIVTNDSYIYRRGNGVISWSEIRIGDSLDVKAVYDKVDEIYAYGSRSYENIWITGITISNETQATITGVTEGGVTVVYPVIPNSVDVYSLRVGSKIRVTLDSGEIELFILLQEAAPTFITGTLLNASSTTVTIRENNGNLTSKVYTYDSSTVIIDAATGNKTTASKLYSATTIYVVTDSGSSNYAKTITILN